MKTLAFLIVISVMVVLFGLKAQAACSDLRYGNAADAGRIETTLQSGSVAESVAAIRAAQSSRGLQLGCAELDYELTAASSVPPTVASIRSAWAKHAESAPAAAAVYDRCPTLGRNGGAYALGGWTARAAKLDFDVSALIAIADNLEATQYRIERTPGELASWPGLYGYAQRLGDSDDSCFVQGVVGEGVARACTTAPQLCQRYRSGRFAGESFVIGDFAAALGVRDGGAGFDQGWAGLMMIEAALGAPDRSSGPRPVGTPSSVIAITKRARIRSASARATSSSPLTVSDTKKPGMTALSWENPIPG